MRMTKWEYEWFGFPADATLSAGVLDDVAVDVFVMGNCHSFAVALHRLTGLPLVRAHNESRPDREPWWHAGVRYGGDFVDVRGRKPMDPDQLDEDVAGAVYEEVPESFFAVDCDDRMPLRVDDALPFARALAIREGIPITEREVQDG
jgi:hypothetical protein